MRTNYVLIDFENVQPESLAALQQDHFKVLVFLGANQGKVPFEVVAALQPLGSRAEYIKISGNGSNALDFHIAFYIGQLAAADPSACFHIISKDTGFDPLIAHLKTKNISAARETDIGEIPLVKATPLAPPPPVGQQALPSPPLIVRPPSPLPPPPLIVRPPSPLRPSKPAQPTKPVSTPAPPQLPPVKKLDPRLYIIIEKLRPAKAPRPRRVKTLTSHIKATFPKTITSEEISSLIADMVARNYITISADNKITYKLK